jgi:hypothetical protein
MDEDSTAAFDAEMRRQHEHPYGPEAATRRKVDVLPAPRLLTERIAELCKQLPGVSQQLAYARTRQREAGAFLTQAQAQFDEIVANLNQAINEHREGTPENVPYPR